MVRQKNDDTKTKLGDIYHYFIVFEHGLNLKENETIYVEKYGDISIDSMKDSKNIEVKHHESNHNLSDRNTDFWKTLKNWVENYESMRLYKKLILFTTSDFPEKTSLENWNDCTEHEKLSILKSIGKEKKKREDSFREFYEKIFSEKEEVIIEIIGKSELYMNNTNVFNIQEQILQHPIFKLIREEDHKSFIYESMGYILTRPAEYPYIWEITSEKFNEIIKGIRDRFSKDLRPLVEPPDYPKIVKDKSQYENRKFVKEIKNIEYFSVIDKAITNYWRTQQTIIYNSHDDPIFLIDLEDYQEELNDTLFYLKEQNKAKCSFKSKEEIIEKSKAYYNEAMLLPTESFGTVNPVRNYFQRGMIHKSVDEGGVIWNLKE